VLVCTLVQVCGLLASEHAIAAPVLCAIVAWVRREPWRGAAVALAPATGLVAAYAISKLVYVRMMPRASLYAMSFDSSAMLQQLGQYVGACFNVLAVQHVTAYTSIAIGVTVILLLVLTMGAALRGSDAARPIAAGLAMFGVSLVPVLILKSHYYDHYICTAALGAVIAVAGCSQSLTRHWRWAFLAFSLALLVFDLQTEEKAWRANGVFRLVVRGSMGSAGWIDAIQHATAARTEPVEVLVPINNITNSIFAFGEAQTFLPGMPARVTRYRPGREVSPAPWQIAVETGSSIQLGEPVPYWNPRWEWLRRLAGVGSDTRLRGAADRT
jgi:hypothetical protein